MAKTKITHENLTGRSGVLRPRVAEWVHNTRSNLLTHARDELVNEVGETLTFEIMAVYLIDGIVFLAVRIDKSGRMVSSIPLNEIEVL